MSFNMKAIATNIFLGITFLLLCCTSTVGATTGSYQMFDNGVIHSSNLGTYATIGKLAEVYMANGSTVTYGFPTGEQFTAPGGECQEFENGKLCENSGNYCEEFRKGNVFGPEYEGKCGTLLQSGVVQLSNVSVVTRNQWGAKYNLDNFETDKYSYFRMYPGRPWTDFYNQIVIHHTAESINQTVQDLEEKTHGQYTAIPYHFVIDKQGTIYEGRPLEYNGDHAFPNKNRLGIVLTGDFEPRIQNFWNPDNPTEEQLKSLEKLVNDIQDNLVMPTHQIVRHNDVGSTECPGDNLEGLIYSRIRIYAENN